MPSKGSTSQRGYGTDHQKIRRNLEPLVASGQATCWRCGNPIASDQQWDLGHDDVDRKHYRGPEHARAADCPAGGNRSTKGRHSSKPSRAW